MIPDGPALFSLLDAHKAYEWQLHDLGIVADMNCNILQQFNGELIFIPLESICYSNNVSSGQWVRVKGCYFVDCTVNYIDLQHTIHLQAII